MVNTILYPIIKFNTKTIDIEKINNYIVTKHGFVYNILNMI